MQLFKRSNFMAEQSFESEEEAFDAATAMVKEMRMSFVKSTLSLSSKKSVIFLSCV